MLDKIKEKLFTWSGGFLSAYCDGTIKHFRKRSAEFVRSTPYSMTKFYYFAVLVFVMLGLFVSGFVVLPAGLIALLYYFIGSAKLAPELFVGALFCILGLIYIILPFVLIRMFGQLIYRTIKDASDDIASKIDGK